MQTRVGGSYAIFRRKLLIQANEVSKVTFDKIQKLVIAGDRGSLCKLLAPLSEEQRQSLSAQAVELAGDIDEFWSPSFSKQSKAPADKRSILDAIAANDYPDWRSPRWASQIVVVATCDVQVLKSPLKHRLSWLRNDLKDMQQRMLEVLAARRPKWLAEWLAWEWKQEFPIAGWYLERGLIRCGAIPPNDSPEYYARMTDETSVIDHQFLSTYDDLPRFKTRRAMLEADPELFKHDLWRVLEVDTSAFRFQTGWPELLLELSRDGILERKQMLSRNLYGLSLPLSVKTLAGMAKFHEQLQPTIEERAALVDDYLRLLHVSNSTVVGAAVSALDKLQKARQLPGQAFLTNMPGAFLADKKTPALASIKLAKKLVQQDASLAEQAAQSLVRALQHADADVQSEAIEALTSLHAAIDASVIDELKSYESSVAIAVRPGLKKLLQLVESKSTAAVSTKTGNSKKDSKASATALPREATTTNPAQPPAKTGKPDTGKPATGKPGSKKAETKGKTRSSASSFKDLPEALRKNSRLDDACAAKEQGLSPSIHPVGKHVIPRRDPARAVAPIADLNELIAAVATMIERIDDPMQLERILDGISRLHEERPADFDKRVDPLRKQLKKKLESFSFGVLDVAAWVGLTKLITTWLDVPYTRDREDIDWWNMRYWFIRQRIHELITHVHEAKAFPDRRKRDEPMPMLAMPTHADGWIDPVILVERINKHYAKSRTLLDDHDFAQAILRLTPDGRQAALKMLGSPDSYNGDVELRFALGDRITRKQSYAERNDDEPDEMIIVFNHGNAMVQVAAVRARMISLADKNYQPELPIAQATIDSKHRVTIHGAVKDDPTVPFSLMETAISFDPTLTCIQDPKSERSWLEQWESMTNPMDYDASCLVGSIWHLFDPESTWTQAACRLAVLSATHDRNEARIMATDALIEAIQRALVVPDLLGTALASNSDIIKLNRVVKVLSDVAKCSSLHHWVILQTLDTYIQHVPELPSDVHVLLAQMLESAIAIGMTASEPAQTRLKSIEGKNKSGKLASQILRLSASVDCETPIHDAIIDAVHARAKRWLTISSAPTRS